MEPSAADLLSANLARLHAGEEELREKALGMIAADDRLGLHLAVTEAAMDLADILRQFQTADEDLKVVQILAVRLQPEQCAHSSRCARDDFPPKLFRRRSKSDWTLASR